jgi:hypothetical protein
MDEEFTSDNGCELRSLLSDCNRKETTEYIYYDIQEGDTLHGICLRYACSVSQVKRLNRLMTDQDFHGLTRLKLPLGKFGLLEDLLQQRDQTRHKSSPGSALSVTTRTNQQAITIEDNEDLLRKDIFEDLDSDVERAKAAAADFEKRVAADYDKLEEVAHLPEFPKENLGLSLKKLLILILFACLVIYLVYNLSIDDDESPSHEPKSADKIYTP